MKLFDIHLFEELDPKEWDNQKTIDPTDLDQMFYDATRRLVAAEHEEKIAAEQLRNFKSKYLMNLTHPQYSQSGPEFKFKVPDGASYVINPQAVKNQDVELLKRYAIKLFLAADYAYKRTSKIHREVQNIKKKLKQKALADLSATPKVTIPLQDIPKKIQIGAGGIKNPYFKYPNRRYAGDLGHYPYMNAAEKRIFAKLAMTLNRFGLAPFTIMYASGEPYKNAYFDDHFVAFAADDKFVWRREGGSNKFFWKGKKLSGEPILSSSEDAIDYQTRVFKHDDYTKPW